MSGAPASQLSPEAALEPQEYRNRTRITEDYAARALPLIHQRLAHAGFRVARLLNTISKTAAAAAVGTVLRPVNQSVPDDVSDPETPPKSKFCLADGSLSLDIDLRF